MQYASITLRNKSYLDCWIYVGVIEVYYLCAKYEIRIKVPKDENVYAVSSKQNIKHLGTIPQEIQYLEIFFEV